MRILVMRVIGLFLGVALVSIPLQPASASSYSKDGVEVSWSTPYLPAKYSCKDITFNYSNKSSVYYDRLWLSLIDKYGDRVGENFAPYVEPGDSGVIRIQVCNSGLKPKGYKLVVETRTDDYKVAVNETRFKFKKRR